MVGINSFLVDLLALQQDGEKAISGPSNWINQEIFLEVPTEVDEVVYELATRILQGNDNDTVARWHFFIGSPGNGKSAATGKLCRKLILNDECRIVDEDGVKIEDLESTSLPYALYVYQRNKPFASAMIVQDASVVRNPYDDNVNPASDLLITLEEAWEKGISLVLCTNRGVIERAYREHYSDNNYREKSWFKILSELIKSDSDTQLGDLGSQWVFDGKRHVFSTTKVTYCYLDNRSLLNSSDVFETLILKAIDNSNWIKCFDCKDAQICPFKANCEWLADNKARQNFLQILCRAEVLSGQVLVFREALAFLSFILSGCARDYGEKHPCEWVHSKSENRDVFALAMRRIYMCVFSPYTPYGLELSKSLQKKQLDCFEIIRNKISPINKCVADSLDFILKKEAPSTDVGIERMIGEVGILNEIDPWRECLPSDFIEKWDTDLSIIFQNGHHLFSDIEQACIKIWMCMEETVESDPSFEAAKCHWAISRWRSNFLIHFGALLEGRTSWGKELDQFITIHRSIRKDIINRSQEENQLIHTLNEELEKLIGIRNNSGSNHQSLPLSSSVTLSGRWVSDKLRPRIDTNKNGALSITVKFPDRETAELSARAFVWLSRNLYGKIDSRCFPGELLTGILDARVRAASKGPDSYAFYNDDVLLEINTENEIKFRISRLDGGVIISEC